MAGREISEGCRAWLAGEIAFWQGAGIVSADQAAEIHGLYETQRQSAQRRVSRAIFVLMGLAAFLVGLAVLLVIGYNWEAMPRPAKVVTIFAVILATYAGAFWARYALRARLASELLFFLACIFYGCGIWLIAQAFHIQSHWPNGIWIWAIGVLPFALCLDTLLLHALLVALLAIWVGAEIIGFQDLFRWRVLGNAAYTLPLLAAPGVLWAYRRRSPLGVALYVPLVAWWIVLQPIAWHASEQVAYFIGAAGAMLLVLADAHRPGDPMAVPFRLWGTLVAGGILVPLSFAEFIQHTQRQGTAGLVMAAMILAAGVLAIVMIVGWRRMAGPRPSPAEIAGAVLKLRFPLALLGLMAGLSAWSAIVGPAEGFRHGFPFDRWSPGVLLPALMTNVAMIGLAIHLMRVGLREDRGRPFTGGVLLFLLWAVLRYFDLFAGVGGMLGAAVMFLLCGLGLFLVARFWQTRKEPIHV